MKHIDIQATENEKKNNLKKEKVNLWAFALFIEALPGFVWVEWFG
jgi:hypothetical protein